MKSTKSLILHRVPVTLQTRFFLATKEQSVFLGNQNPQIKSSATWGGSREAEAGAGAGRCCSAARPRAAPSPREALGALHHPQELGQGWDNLPPPVCAPIRPPWARQRLAWQSEGLLSSQKVQGGSGLQARICCLWLCRGWIWPAVFSLRPCPCASLSRDYLLAVQEL